jgi:hypothetical protein
LTKSDKRLRQQVKKYIDRELLLSFENEIIHFIRKYLLKELDYELVSVSDDVSDVSQDDGWVSITTADENTLCFRVTNSFLRLLVHAMCRYYCLVSTSVETPNGKIVSIKLPFDKFVETIYEFPKESFTEYFLA